MAAVGRHEVVTGVCSFVLPQDSSRAAKCSEHGHCTRCSLAQPLKSMVDTSQFCSSELWLSESPQVLQSHWWAKRPVVLFNKLLTLHLCDDCRSDRVCLSDLRSAAWFVKACLAAERYGVLMCCTWRTSYHVVLNTVLALGKWLTPWSCAGNQPECGVMQPCCSKLFAYKEACWRPDGTLSQSQCGECHHTARTHSSHRPPNALSLKTTCGQSRLSRYATITGHTWSKHSRHNPQLSGPS